MADAVFRKRHTAIFCIFTIIAVILAALPLSTYAAPVGANIGIEVTAGYDDVARVGSSVPFVVSLVNKGDEVSGELQVLVNINSGSRVIYAVPFSLPEDSSKELIVDVPVYTANRKVEVRLVRDGKVIRTRDYEFRKLISPGTPVIGILSDDPEAFRGLSGVKLAENMDDAIADEYAMKMAVAKAAGVTRETISLPDTPAELVFLDAGTVPDTREVMEGFDILIIDNADTALLSDAQADAVEQWISEGNMLFIGTGTNWRKTYSGMKDSLKPFRIQGSAKLESAGSLGAFAEESAPGGSLDIVTGDIGDGAVILGEGNTPLVVSYARDMGYIAVLAFDAALEPVAGWSGSQSMWKKLISTVAEQGRQSSGTGSNTVFQPVKPGTNYQHLASDVPETQTPPFVMLLIIIGVYVLLVGPAIYLFLKRKDRRDWNWVVIPAVSVMFMTFIYFAGFRTRYNTAVLNSFSLININQAARSVETGTTMGLFNNQRGNMRLEYDSALNLNINPDGQYYYDPYISYSPSGEGSNGKVVSKFIESDPPVYELYDVRMWEPRFVSAYQQKPMQGNFIDDVSIRDGKLKAVIRNNTVFNMEDAYIVVGNSFIEIGDIPAGQDRNIDVELEGPSVIKRFADFLDSRYGQAYYTKQINKSPDDWKKDLRKRNAIESVFNTMYSGMRNQAGIHFFALNYDDLGYDILVNGKQPEKYSANIIYSNAGFDFSKGAEVDIPSGIIIPVMQESKGAYYDDQLNGGIRVHSDGDIEFSFPMMTNVDVRKFRINWSTFLPVYVKYRSMGQSKQTQPQYAKNTYKFYIYNNSTAQWEETGTEFAADSGLDAYILNNEIKVKANVTLDQSGMQEEMLSIPEIEISGVVE